jgi:hypothetical protein
MDTSTDSRGRTTRPWFNIARAFAATALLALVSGAPGDAAQVFRTSGPAAGAQPPPLLSRFVRARLSRTPLPQSRSAGWINPAGKPVVWFSMLGAFTPGTGAVNSYDAEGNLTGSLTGLYAPFGVSVDKNGNVYVANTFAQQVLIYKKGATLPTLTLDDPGFLPWSIAINEADGSVAVGNLCQGDPVNFCTGDGNTLIYKRGATKPSMTFHGVGRQYSVAYDASGRLWADGFLSYTIGPPVVGYYVNHGAAFHVFPVTPGLQQGGTVGFDKMGNLDVLDPSGGLSHDPRFTCSVLTIYKPGDTSPLRILNLGECLSDTVNVVALNKHSTGFWALETYAANLFLGLLYAYPTGQLQIHRSILFPVTDDVYGVATQPS